MNELSIKIYSKKVTQMRRTFLKKYYTILLTFVCPFVTLIFFYVLLCKNALRLCKMTLSYTLWCLFKKNINVKINRGLFRKLSIKLRNLRSKLHIPSCIYFSNILLIWFHWFRQLWFHVCWCFCATVCDNKKGSIISSTQRLYKHDMKDMKAYIKKKQ